MINISDTLNHLLQNHSYGAIISELLQAAKESGKFDPIKRNEILRNHRFAFKCFYVNDALNAIFDYVAIILEDNALTEEEWISVRWLKAYLNVRERDFFLFGKEKQIRRIVTEQLRKLYADNLIERQEAIMQSEMQGLFGLSSAKYSRYVDEIKHEAIKNGADRIDLIKNT